MNDGLDDVAGLIADARSLYSRDHSSIGTLDELDARLREPLRLALAGIVKAGKSTLLNALLGEQIAPTDAGESTKVVTWYRYADTPSITLHPHDGPSRRLPIRRVAGQLVIDMDATLADEVERIDIGWPAPVLKSVILIDTPGIASLSSDVSTRSLDFLIPSDAPSSADAIVYLMRHLHPSDLGFLEAFRDTAAGASQTVNAVGVLSRADEIGSGRIDSLLSAGKVASRYERDGELARLVLGVVPVAGLLAEGARTLRESEFRAFRALANCDRGVRERLLISADRFTAPTADLALDAGTRRQLLARFGLFGVRLAVSLIRAGAPDSEQLAAQLIEHSGLVELKDVIDRRFQSRAATLKIRAVLDGLERLLDAAPRPGDEQVRAGIERIRAGAHGLRELSLLSQAQVSGLGLPDGLSAEAVRIVGGDGLDAASRLGLAEAADPSSGQLRRQVASAIDSWRIQAMSPLLNRPGVDACRIVIRSLDQIASGLAADTGDLAQPAADIVAPGGPADGRRQVADQQRERDGYDLAG